MLVRYFAMSFICLMFFQNQTKRIIHFEFNPSFGDKKHIVSEKEILFFLDGERFMFSSDRMSSDTVSCLEFSKLKTTRPVREREIESEWLDSINAVYMKNHGVPHPYGLVRNIDNFYEKLYVLEKIDTNQYIKYEVVWELVID